MLVDVEMVGRHDQFRFGVVQVGARCRARRRRPARRGRPAAASRAPAPAGRCRRPSGNARRADTGATPAVPAPASPGASRSTLVGRLWKFRSTGWPGFSAAASLTASIRPFGRRTNSSPSRPSGDGLSLEPWCGVPRKITRFTHGSRSKKKMRCSSSRVSGRSVRSPNGRSLTSRQKSSPLSTVNSFETRPPMLWPTSTIWSRAASLVVRVELGAKLFQVAAQVGGRGQVGVAGRVEVEPELEAVAQHRVGPQVVEHRRPRQRRRQQAVDQHDGDLARLVRLQHVNAVAALEESPRRKPT